MNGHDGRKLGVAISILAVVGATAATFAITRPETAAPITAAPTQVTVYKSSSCRCCANWVEHLRANGFEVTAVDTEDLPALKARYGIDSGLASCHTAVVEDYVIEGHVPADLIARLIEERPEIAGLAVPGMPMGAPGMEGARRDPYDVLAFDSEGNTRVYASR